MSQDPIAVDPEQLKNLSEPYHSAAADFKALHGRIQELGARYSNAWGNDSTGQQFGPQFTEGLEALEGRVKGVHQTLSYFGDGLRDNGSLFGQADDNAHEVSRTLNEGLEPLRSTGKPHVLAAGTGDGTATERHLEALTPTTPAVPMTKRLLEAREVSPAIPAVPEGAVIDPAIPADDFGPWYRMPDGTVIAHPAIAAHLTPRTPARPPDS